MINTWTFKERKQKITLEKVIDNITIRKKMKIVCRKYRRKVTTQ